MNSIRLFTCNYCHESRMWDQMIPNPKWSFEAPSFKCEWCVRDNVSEPKKIEKPKNEFFERIFSKNKRRR